ncbi:MAG: PBSX family phage terminase large subunit [Firmicutes bacterium]|nr:PBSX family phage terminase large subunit [Bacillota bacterium]
MKTKTHKNIWLPEIVGKGYGDYWNFKGRYRVCKGSRASKKSKTTALNMICRMMQYKNANLLVIRKVFATIKDSCYSELQWAIERLSVGGYWECKRSPLEMVYLPTGQKIFFRGLDDPLKITSITVKKGELCWLWIEEAYEISRESDFDMLDESIRGKTSKGLFKQITLTLNPWNEKHWIKKRFFDVQSKEIMAKTTNYLCNEFLDEADIRVFENMRLNNPQRYKVAGLGEWGISEGLIYENWEEKFFDTQEISKRDGIRSVFGLDFGYTNDPTALFCALADERNMEMFVFDEIYKRAMTNRDIYDAIAEKGFAKERIIADSAEPKSIEELRQLGLKNITAAAKGKDSILNGIQKLQNYRIFIHPKCVNFITEISNYTWQKDKGGNSINRPCDMFNHLLDAARYAIEESVSKNGKVSRVSDYGIW